MIETAPLYRCGICQNNFRKAIEESNLSGISVIDLEGKITYINPGFCRMIGYSTSDLMGSKPPFVFWPPEENERLASIYLNAMEGDTPEAGVEIRLLRQDGKRFDALLLLSPMRDNKGQTNGWLTAVTDTSALKNTQQQLRDSEELYRTLAENFPNGLVGLFDRDLRCTLMVGDGIRLLNENNISVVGKTLLEVLTPENPTSALLEHAILDAFHGTRITLETTLFGRMFNFFFIPVRSGEGLVDQVMLMSQDITDQNESKARFTLFGTPDYINQVITLLK
jgi:PAS domain S-box-containing protein